MIILSYLPTLIFLAAFLVFAIVSLILVYHWHRYGRGDAKVMLFETAYFVAGIAIIISAVGALSQL